MIDVITLENVKAHAHTRIEASPFTLLVGPNGSGKTTVLDAAWWLMRSRPQASSHEWTADLLRRGETTASVEINFRSAGVPHRNTLGLHDDGRTTEWAFEHSRDGHLLERLASVLGEDAPPIEIEGLETRLLRLESHAIRVGRRPGRRVNASGAGLAQALADLKLGEDEAFAAIERDLRRVIPSFSKIRITRTEDRSEQVALDMVGGDRIPSAHISEGTLLALALITALNLPPHPQLVLIDDLQKGLHPTAQVELVRLILELVNDREDLQVIASTHSPFIVDEVDADSVWAFASNEHGISGARRLSDHPNASKALEVLTTGELWTSQPEAEWVSKR